jgi:hypothetical protein
MRNAALPAVYFSSLTRFAHRRTPALPGHPPAAGRGRAVTDLWSCPTTRRMTILPACSASPKLRLRQSAPPMSRAASSPPRSNCAGCSPASLTTPRHGSAPGPSPAGRHGRPRCPRRRSGPASGGPDPSPSPPTSSRRLAITVSGRPAIQGRGTWIASLTENQPSLPSE